MLNKYIVEKEFIEEEQRKIIDFFNSFLKRYDIQGIRSINPKNYITLNQMVKINYKVFKIDRSPDVYKPIGTMTKTNYAYIYIPDYLGNLQGGNVERSDKFAFIILNIISYLHKQKPVGWIFDLRSNTGGIIYSFILGFLSIFDNFVINCLDKKDIKRMELVYDGTMLYYQYNDQKRKSIGILPPIEKKKLKNVNVLINNNTASCGELLTYLLKKQYNATIYGETSYGIASWIAYYDISGYEDIVSDLHLYYPELQFDFSDSDLKLEKNVNQNTIIKMITSDFSQIPFDTFGMF